MNAANASTQSTEAGTEKVHAQTPQHAFGKDRALCYDGRSAPMTIPRPTAAPGTVLALLDAAVAHVPERRAVADEHETLTWSALAARVAAGRDALRAAGIGPGAHVAIVLPSSVAFVESLLAVLATGAAAFPAPATARIGELRRLVEGTAIDAIVAPAGDDRAIAPLRIAARPGGLAVIDPPARSANAPQTREPRPDDVALVASTSGTLSRPHVVTRTHANL